MFSCVNQWLSRDGIDGFAIMIASPGILTEFSTKEVLLVKNKSRKFGTRIGILASCLETNSQQMSTS